VFCCVGMAGLMSRAPLPVELPRGIGGQGTLVAVSASDAAQACLFACVQTHQTCLHAALAFWVDPRVHEGADWGGACTLVL